jgi:hypothetical protein
MKKILPALVLMIFTCVASNSIFAAEVLKDDHPDRYLVVKGDTLWDISSMFLSDPWMWPDIWHVNPEIEDPHLIYPGDLIFLRFVEGQPQLRLRRGEESRTAGNRSGDGRSGNDRSGNSGDKNRLEPSIRSSPLADAIPAIEFDKIANLLQLGRIVGKRTLDRAPYVLDSISGRLLFGEGDSFYARGKWTEGTSIYGLYREGQIYRDPDTHDILGYEARELGTAKLLARERDMRTFELTSVKEEVRLGDRLLPTEEIRFESMIFPAPPENDIDGVIISVVGGMSNVGKSDVVVFNRGLKAGLDVGTVLAIHKRGARVKDRFGGGKVTLPSERAGVVLTVRSYEKMSYGFVLETTIPLRVGDLVRSP